MVAAEQRLEGGGRTETLRPRTVDLEPVERVHRQRQLRIEAAFGLVDRVGAALGLAGAVAVQIVIIVAQARDEIDDAVAEGGLGEHAAGSRIARRIDAALPPSRHSPGTIRRRRPPPPRPGRDRTARCSTCRSPSLRRSRCARIGADRDRGIVGHVDLIVITVQAEIDQRVVGRVGEVRRIRLRIDGLVVGIGAEGVVVEHAADGETSVLGRVDAGLEQAEVRSCAV